MKRLPLALFPLLLFLGACTLFAPSTPSSDVIQTSVAQILTAYPTQTPAIIYMASTESAPPDGLPDDLPTATTPAPTSTPAAPPPPQTIVIVYPTPVVSSPPIVYPTAIPSWSPAYVDQFVQYYYQRINARDYTTSWSLLTNAFKAVVNPDGYAGYVAYWNTVARVDVQYVTINSWSGNYATVVVSLVYNYVNGYAASSTQTFLLFYDAYRVTWMFDTATPPLPTPVPTAWPTAVPTAVAIPYYPADFIYYYFNNINSRNYPLTWSLLTASFIANNNPPASGGYTGYVNFWNSVSLVQITGVSVNSLSGSYATVTVAMTFYYSSGLVTTATPTYYLVYNYGLGSWQFYSPY